MFGEQTLEGRRENLSQANKLSRTYATLLEALNRHRGKGQQKVTVEHVHVHSGGQAVVGVVETPGGGNRLKSKDQSHAEQITHAPQPAVWNTDPEKEPVSVASVAAALDDICLVAGIEVQSPEHDDMSRLLMHFYRNGRRTVDQLKTAFDPATLFG